MIMETLMKHQFRCQPLCKGIGHFFVQKIEGIIPEGNMFPLKITALVEEGTKIEDIIKELRDRNNFYWYVGLIDKTGMDHRDIIKLQLRFKELEFSLDRAIGDYLPVMFSFTCISAEFSNVASDSSKFN